MLWVFTFSLQIHKQRIFGLCVSIRHQNRQCSLNWTALNKLHNCSRWIRKYDWRFNGCQAISYFFFRFACYSFAWSVCFSIFTERVKNAFWWIGVCVRTLDMSVTTVTVSMKRMSSLLRLPVHADPNADDIRRLFSNILRQFISGSILALLVINSPRNQPIYSQHRVLEVS